MRLRNDILKIAGRLLRVCIIARYSKEERKRKKRSNKAQVLLCKQFLKQWDLKDDEVVIEVIADEGISGELVERPGILTLRDRINGRAYDLIIAEDSSRLYRNPSACDQLVGMAVDNGVRVIFPGDSVDTEDVDWQSTLATAQQHHSQSNQYTRNRLKRATEERWDSGVAMGPLKPGYMRRPINPPTTTNEPAEGPFLDDIDPNWAPAVKEAFERVARREPLWSVATWLNQVGLPKIANSLSLAWSEKNVIALIRRTVYRGVEEYGLTFTKKLHKTGKGKSHRQDKKKIWTRPMEHHRIVPDHLWYEANAVIKDRTTQPSPPQGLDHPLAGIPRDSRGPLSKLFVCGICVSKMYMEGRRTGGYRCSKAKKCGCWNKATSSRELTHKQIGAAIAAEFSAGDGIADVLVNHIEQQLESDEPLQKRLAELVAIIQDLTLTCERLVDEAERGKVESVFLHQRLQKREQELTEAKAEFAHLQQQAGARPKLPSREEITARIQQASRELLNFSPEAGVLLQRLLVGKILAVPYQQFGGDKVVLRAEFKIDVLGILPGDLDSVLRGSGIKDSIPTEIRTLCIDLFEPSVVPHNASAAWGLRKAGVMPKEIAKTLGLSKRQTTQAVKMGREMEEANIKDPYIRLTERPASASRWKSRRPAPNDGDDATDDAA